MFKQQVGIIGMAVMGKNLALNIESKGYTISIFNRSPKSTNEVILNNPNKNIKPYYTLKNFVKSIVKPRRIFIMVKSGEATNEVIKYLIKFIDKKDIIIDCGNTYYKESIKKNKQLNKKGIYYIGTGISGGEKGALKGPAIMPGGNKKAYKLISPILKKIAAIYKNEPCVSYIGENGSGHYVKMIHNGIEYSDMQLISEAYFILKTGLNLNNKEISEIFNNWNNGELNSYLIEITKNILIKKDKSKKYLIDNILDKADNKGTGKWMSKNALDLEEPSCLTTQSVFTRYLSYMKSQRVKASKILLGPKKNTYKIKNKTKFIEKIRKSLYFSKIISYAQGFSQLKKASEKYNWNLNYIKIAKIFRSGCIIKAKILKKIIKVYFENPNISNILTTNYFKEITNNYQNSLRDIISYSTQIGIPIPTFSVAISYYDSYRCAKLPTNLIQAQRDYFGAHTYKRYDKSGNFHTEWLK
ncbi:NADP-dependent phosphogluconate dehydrogenase [Enterobacteriaceae bacterium ET-AT1-13]|nr:NADP-dependent phosphogluconate dehydrogenase [Enterobacteriaceae bacterium ET-AT1-13]WGS66493.1 NADP-dependent phosphogluconate dehydrogenase [Enterobacteriaceae bacterium Cmel17]WMC17517.1 MAG: NADP-dependent phosphogluconate dehydrogenase [Enterobacteriaceae bacterium Cmel21]WMC17724.1 MAG: NADP-dependent phosphogluconate dehydrogenase [Enterobacteriaceae bacterium PSmelAO3-2]WMC17928.1 MAG: NADP-dependent phosphogluconate dehydrogenase [Enterobacteriaceae bacterium PSmelAO3-1]WMC18131.1